MGTPAFRFFHPVEVRYADLDPQRHVNNAVYFTYMEQARARYLEHLGLWAGDDFDRLGIILAQATCRFLRPIGYGQSLRVGAATLSLGKKSFEMAHTIRGDKSSDEFASGRVVLVAYDYRASASVPLPESWRMKISEYEGPSLLAPGLDQSEDKGSRR